MFTIQIHYNASPMKQTLVFWATRGRFFPETVLFFCHLINSENPKFTGHEAALQVYVFVEVIFLVNYFNGNWERFFCYCCFSSKQYHVILNISATRYCLLFFLTDLQKSSQRSSHMHWQLPTSTMVCFAAHKWTKEAGPSGHYLGFPHLVIL